MECPICKECGKKINRFALDLYEIGDRLLEGIYLNIEIDDQGNISAFTRKEDESYWDYLNKSKWIKLAIEYVKSCDYIVCPFCGEEIEISHLPIQATIQAKKFPFDSFFSGGFDKG